MGDLRSLELFFDRLREFGCELSDDRRNAVLEAFKSLDDPSPIGGWSLLEGYVAGIDEIHIHGVFKPALSGEVPNHADTREFCAVLHWPELPALENCRDDLVGNLLLGSPSDRRNLPFPVGGVDVVKAGECSEDGDGVVLVPVREFIEDGCPVSLRSLPMCCKRLQRLEACVKSRIHLDQLTLDGLFPLSACVAGFDGEVDVAPRISVGDLPTRSRPGVSLAQLPDHVVEGGAEVVDHV